VLVLALALPIGLEDTVGRGVLPKWAFLAQLVPDLAPSFFEGARGAEEALSAGHAATTIPE
jgi:hypothetical protein